MQDHKLLEINKDLHKQLKALSKEKKIPIKYLVEEAIKNLLDMNKESA
jgi:hypothetical protein